MDFSTNSTIANNHINRSTPPPRSSPPGGDYNGDFTSIQYMIFVFVFWIALGIILWCICYYKFNIRNNGNRNNHENNGNNSVQKRNKIDEKAFAYLNEFLKQHFFINDKLITLSLPSLPPSSSSFLSPNEDEELDGDNESQAELSNSLEKKVDEKEQHSTIDGEGTILSSPLTTSTTDCSISKLEQDVNKQSVHDRCAICLERYTDGDTIIVSTNENCNHIFHHDCVVPFLATSFLQKRKKVRRALSTSNTPSTTIQQSEQQEQEHHDERDEDLEMQQTRQPEEQEDNQSDEDIQNVPSTPSITTEPNATTVTSANPNTISNAPFDPAETILAMMPCPYCRQSYCQFTSLEQETLYKELIESKRRRKEDTNGLNGETQQ